MRIWHCGIFKLFSDLEDYFFTEENACSLLIDFCTVHFLEGAYAV
jgi:hypothetical protein